MLIPMFLISIQTDKFLIHVNPTLTLWGRKCVFSLIVLKVNKLFLNEVDKSRGSNLRLLMFPYCLNNKW